jgi:hypothetical protein
MAAITRICKYSVSVVMAKVYFSEKSAFRIFDPAVSAYGCFAIDV